MKKKYILIRTILIILAVTIVSCASPKIRNGDPIISNNGKTPLCPKNGIVNSYSHPKSPVEYRCCSSNSPGVLAPTSNSATNSGNIMTSLLSEVSHTCVKVDASNIVNPTVPIGQTCTSFITYEHFTCSCEMNCGCGQNNSPAWKCDCPDVPEGELPIVKQQNSLRSEIEFIGQTTYICSTRSPDFDR